MVDVIAVCTPTSPDAEHFAAACAALGTCSWEDRRRAEWLATLVVGAVCACNTGAHPPTPIEFLTKWPAERVARFADDLAVWSEQAYAAGLFNGIEACVLAAVERHTPHRLT